MQDRVDPRETLQRAEEAFRGALIAADGDRLNALLGEEYIYGHGSGRIDEKGGYIRLITGDKFRISDISTNTVVTNLYGDAAVVTGETSVMKDEKGAKKVARYRFVRVWTKTPTGWRLVHYQHTRIPSA